MTAPFAGRLDGHGAVVTAAGAGIGQAVAIGLARAGARVALLEIDPDRLAQTAGLVGDGALPLQVDMMDTDAVRAAIATAASEFGRLDVLVNNAGGVNGRRFLDQSERSWRRHIDINLVSMLAAISAAAPVMIDGRRGGAILNISSIEGVRAAPMYAVYAACKAGMVNFTESMAVELGEHGIRVNSMAPDHTATAGLRGIMTGAVDPADLPARPAEELDGIRRYVPLGREGTAAEFADTAVFLCTDLASYVTGACIHIDGGTNAAAGWLRSGGSWSLYGHTPMPTVGRKGR